VDESERVRRSCAGERLLLKVRIPHDTTEFVVSKGSIAIDGVSLTVIEYGKGGLVTVTVGPVHARSHPWPRATGRERGQHRSRCTRQVRPALRGKARSGCGIVTLVRC